MPPTPLGRCRIGRGCSSSDPTAGLPSAEARRRLDDPDCPFDLGVHLNLTQGRPLGDRYPGELLDAEGRFPGVFSLFARCGGRATSYAMRFETSGGDKFSSSAITVCGRRTSTAISMLKCCQPSAELVPDLMKHFNIKAVRVAWEPGLLRSTVLHGFGIAKWPLARVKHVFAARLRKFIDARRIAHPGAFYGTAHAGGVDLRLLRRFLASSGGQGFIEIGLHPGQAAEETSPEDESNGWRDPLAKSRPRELQMLVSQELSQCLESAARRLGRLQLLKG